MIRIKMWPIYVEPEMTFSINRYFPYYLGKHGSTAPIAATGKPLIGCPSM
jgi:hypothetical protein